MAADNRPPLAQRAVPRAATSREIIQVAGDPTALAAVMTSGMSLVASKPSAPSREDMRSMRVDMQGRFEAIRCVVNYFRKDIHDRFKAVHAHMAGLRERWSM